MPPGLHGSLPLALRSLQINTPMRNVLGLIATLVALSCGVLAQSGELIEIDGAKSPELIPEYVLWESTFSYLDYQRKQKDPGVMEGLRVKYLPLSEADYPLVWAAAERYVAMRTENQRVLKERFDEWIGVSKGEELKNGGDVSGAADFPATGRPGFGGRAACEADTGRAGGSD